MHMVCLIGDKQVDKWLCAECAKEFLPGGVDQMPITAEGARNFLDRLLGGAKKRKKITAEGFSENAAAVLGAAASRAVDLGSRHIGTEHILYGLLTVEGCTGHKLLRELHENIEEILTELEKWMDKGSSTAQVPQYSQRAKQVLEQAAADARSLRQEYVGSEQLIAGIVAAGDGIACQVLAKFGITPEKLRIKLEALHEEEGAVPGRRPGQGGLSAGKSDVFEQLGEFGRNLNEEAKAGRIEPVIGRESEIERLIQILCRRTKNNPVIIGEAGVGKTAVAEGLAQKILMGQVPEFLQGKVIFSLEVGLLVAGSKYRGEFEERMKQLLALLREQKDIIVFIDELHTIIGAGSAEGSVDVANIIKPALSRGELQVIGATTVKEYRKYIEKDPALERRFQPLMVNAPDNAESVKMLQGLKRHYEKYHNLEIAPEAIKAAVELSDRYITDRNLPDKAIDVMDEACARVRIKAYRKAEPARKLKEELEDVQASKQEALEKEQYETVFELRDKEAELQNRLEALSARLAQKSNVTREDIAEVVSSWTGIPLARLTEEESARLLKLEERLHQRVVGQQEAVSAVSRAVRRARAGFKDPKRPAGSFLFLGPTGVGKTELAKALAEELFGDERAMFRFDMSEYMEKHTTARLVGSPPGYVGYSEGGQLTDAVRSKPYSVILLDEIEKAHPDVFNLLLQIMEDGRLTDGQGRTVNFCNTVLIMTSNAGARSLAGSKPLGFALGEKEEAAGKKAKVLEEVRRIFRPEFLNRIDETLVFDALTASDLEQICANMLKDLNRRLAASGLSISLTDAAVKLLLAEGTDNRYGARPLRRAVRKLLEDPVSDLYLSGSFSAGDTILADAGQDGRLWFRKADSGARIVLELPEPAACGLKGAQNG